MAPRKILFFAVLAVVVIAIGIGFSMLSKKKTTTTLVWPATLSIWVVGDDAAGYEDIIGGFKARYPLYAETDIKVTKFADYADYEKTLLNVIADGKSPDIFMVPSDGSKLLESKIQTIKGSEIDTDVFGSSFNKIFDDLVVESMTKNKDGDDIRITELKGVPMSYETPGVFYNLDIITNAVPGTWSELEKSFSDSVSSWAVLAGIGLSGRYTPNIADIVSLLMVQNGIKSYQNFDDPNAVNALMKYAAYGPSSTDGVSVAITPNGNGLGALKEEMDRLKLTTTDMFVRGKIGFIIGYPSFIREIQYSIKRAGELSVLGSKNLRSTTIPVIDLANQVNLVRYNYFALSRDAQEVRAGINFLQYLAAVEKPQAQPNSDQSNVPASKSAQELYMAKFPYTLPALNSLVEKRQSQLFDKNFPRIKYASFFPTPEMRLQTFDKGLVSEFSSYISRSYDPTLDPRDTVSSLKKYLECNKKHLIDGVGFEESCTIR